MIKTLYKQIGKYKRASLLTPVLTACEVVLDVMIPYVTASLIDKGISAGNIQNVYLYGAIMLGMAFLSLMFGILSARFASYASTGFASNVRSAMYRSIQRFSFSDIDKYSTAGLVTRMTTDVSNLQNAFQQILRITVRAPFRLVLSIIMCLVIDARLSVIFIIALIILSFSLGYIISHVSRLFTQVYKQYDQLNQSVQENVSAIRVVKAFVREDHENKKFAHAAEGLYKLFTRAETLMAFNHPIMNMVVYGCIIALSWFGAHYIVGGTLTTGELTSLFTYVMAILHVADDAQHDLRHAHPECGQRPACGRGHQRGGRHQNPPHPITHVPDGSIELDHVWFAYGSSEKQEREKANEPQDQRLTALLSTLQSEPDYALKDITLSIRPGETIGVIGGTGSGKSSMVTLISRLYDVSRGTLKVGGNDVRQYDLTTLRNAVSVVLQQNMLFSGTILDNLRWGNADATLEQCRQACHWAQADEFIDQMPDGYNTHIEQGGTNVSGGQKQRLCIARALLKSPKILVLDDSTSACDTATDAKIRHAFSTELRGMTKLIIAQRIASVKDCDRILVLDNGRMTGFDTHANLLRNNRLYQEIYKIQTEDGGDFDEKTNRTE